LTNCAIRKSLNKLRITSNEPYDLLFILETNGILIGDDLKLAKQPTVIARLKKAKSPKKGISASKLEIEDLSFSLISAPYLYKPVKSFIIKKANFKIIKKA